MSKLYDMAKSALLKAIAYKFEVRAQIHETLTGCSGGAHRAVRDLSRVVANESSGIISDSDNARVAQSLAYARFQ